jgi:hypothetical protein
MKKRGTPENVKELNKKTSDGKIGIPGNTKGLNKKDP